MRESSFERSSESFSSNNAIEEDESEMQEKGNVLWIIGLDGFEHLFEPTEFDVVPIAAVSSFTGASIDIKFNNQIMDNLNSILKDAFGLPQDVLLLKSKPKKTKKEN